MKIAAHNDRITADDFNRSKEIFEKEQRGKYVSMNERFGFIVSYGATIANPPARKKKKKPRSIREHLLIQLDIGVAYCCKKHSDENTKDHDAYVVKLKKQMIRANLHHKAKDFLY